MMVKTNIAAQIPWHVRQSIRMVLLIIPVVLSTTVFAEHDRGRLLIHKQHQEQRLLFAQEMNQLADEVAKLSYLSAAEQIRTRAQSVSSPANDIDDLPTDRSAEIPVSLPAQDRAWRLKLKKLEEEYAAGLWLLSRRAIKLGYPSDAFQLVREVAFHQPDHEHARRMLGFVLHEGKWKTPFARTMEVKGYIDHEQFGWIQSKHVERYLNGERRLNGKWVSVEKEASLRTHFRNAWVVETEHFSVRTNHSLEKGVEISRNLELFHRFFVRDFAAFFNTRQQMQSLFNTGDARPHSSTKRFDVYYFKNRNEFIAALKQRQRNIEVAIGIYRPDDRVAYFFHDPEPDTPTNETMFHEVTHQIMSESTSAKIDNLGQYANFWLVEGIACYMESVRIDKQGKLHVGDPNHIRVRSAQHYLVQEGFFIPIQQFTSLGINEFQAPADTRTLQRYYAQATALTHFFLHADDGKFRDAFISHVANVYSPVARIRNKPPTLEKETETAFAGLDVQYKNYLSSLSNDSSSPEGGSE